MKRPEPPAAHYVALGRLTSNAAMAELQVGMLGWAAINRRSYPQPDHSKAAGKPGRARRLLQQAVVDRPAYSLQLQELSDAFDEVISRRHQYIHGVLAFDLARTGEQWVIETMRGEIVPALDSPEQATIAHDLLEVARSADSLRREIEAADRTSSGPQSDPI